MRLRENHQEKKNKTEQAKEMTEKEEWMQKGRNF